MPRPSGPLNPAAAAERWPVMDARSPPCGGDRPGGGVVLNFDHNDFATTDGARAWTTGWATKMLALKKYAETGQRDRCFA
jgi:hypothetical protein